MKKTILYILLQFSSAALADWITVEHDFKMCGQDVPSKRAAVHINDDGFTYSSSLLVKDIHTINHESPSTTVNVTMWGCTYDCQFSFMLKVNKDDHTVSSFINQKEDNYICNLSKSTSKLIPTPKITYQKELPNPDYIFPTHLTAKYCSEGKHPDAPNFPIKQTENVAECIDELTGNTVGTYAASLQFGSGSSFKPDGYGIATYNMINSANKLFDYWESQHRGLHDSLNELSLKAAELSKLKPPTSKSNVLKNIVPMVAGIAPLAVPITVGINDVINDVVNEITESSFTKISKLAAEIGAADDVIASAKGTAKNAAVEWRDAAMKSDVAQIANSLDKGCNQTSSCLNLYTQKSTIEYIGELYGKSENPNLGQILAALNKLDDGITKRDTVDDLGFFTTNMMNLYYLPSLMDRVHQSMNDSDYSDVSSFLSAASTKLLSQFEDTLHNNFFTGNKSLLDSFTANQVVNHDQILANYDDVYKTIKNGTYDNMAVSIISANVEICDPKPSFCGQSCNDGLGIIYCPKIGKDGCITTASDSQIKEFNLLRDISDICSNDKSTGWNITHNPHCDIKLFQCLSLPKNHKN